MTNLSFIAGNGSLDEFLAEYEPSDAMWASPSTGEPLLKFAVGNHDADARVAIATRLLDDGADPSWSADNGTNLLHVLLGRRTHDFAAEAPLVARLIAGGADINEVAVRFGTPLETATMRSAYTDEELAPIYDVFFAQPDLDLLEESVFKKPVIANLRNCIRPRPGLIGRAEAYLAERGLSES